MADQFAVALGDAAHLLHQRRHGIDDIKHLLAGVEQIDLVRGDKRA
jgi:hypothetical protein